MVGDGRGTLQKNDNDKNTAENIFLQCATGEAINRAGNMGAVAWWPIDEWSEGRDSAKNELAPTWTQWRKEAMKQSGGGGAEINDVQHTVEITKQNRHQQYQEIYFCTL